VVFAPTDHPFTFTVYDAADAPAELLNRADTNGTAETCTEQPDGSTVCTSSGQGFSSSTDPGPTLGTLSDGLIESGSTDGTTETSIVTNATIAPVP
jgi:hypothetical protein